MKQHPPIETAIKDIVTRRAVHAGCNPRAAQSRADRAVRLLRQGHTAHRAITIATHRKQQP